MLCPECYSSQFRLSRFRLRDVRHLAMLKYPVRCRSCKARVFATWLQAVKMSRTHPKRAHEVSTP